MNPRCGAVLHVREGKPLLLHHIRHRDQRLDLVQAVHEGDDLPAKVLADQLVPTEHRDPGAGNAPPVRKGSDSALLDAFPEIPHQIRKRGRRVQRPNVVEKRRTASATAATFRTPAAASLNMAGSVIRLHTACTTAAVGPDDHSNGAELEST